MSNKALLFTLVVALFSLMMSCNDSGPGKINLEITAVSPDSGSVGTEVTISGSGFVPKASDNIVKFNDTEAQVISVTSEQIVTQVPVGATSGPIVVEVGGKEVTGPSFVITDGSGGGDPPSINSLDPTEGPVQTAVTITGSNFSPIASENTVTFGDAKASVSAASTTELTAIVPEELSPGMFDVRVTVDKQTALAPNQFTVTQDDGDNTNNPSVGDISPTEGPVGTEVTITGENFSPTPGNNTVTFNGTEATINSASETELVAVVPDGATSGPVAVTVDGKTAIGPNFTVTDDGGGSDPNAPSIDSINPTEGPVGTSVTISGSNFSNTASENTVTFGGTEASISAVSTTELTVIVPDGLSPGTVAVQVIVNGQTATGPDFTVTDDGSSGGNPPSIGGINPTEGPVGTEVTITGENFSPTPGNNTVTFNGTEATINSASETELVAVVPDGATTGPVAVTVGGQTATGPQFTVTDDGSGGDNNPSIGSIDPTEGPTGTAVTISGSNFSATAADNTVKFGDATATVTSASETELVAEVPSTLSAGDVVPVSVTVGGQTATGPDFTVTDGGGGGNAPSISGINPTEGPIGTEVTISGSNFSATADENTVKFGDTEAQITSASETELTAVVPDGLSPGDVVPVSVTVGGQTATGPDFTVTDGGGGGSAPSISGISPTEGPTGTEVTITGENFSATASENTVTFNGAEATINSASQTELIAVVPDSATTGPVAVTVGGQTATGPDFTVTDGGGGGNAPSISGINPTEGPTGTAVTISGSNFSATASENTVEFGSEGATVTSASETELVAEVPSALSAGDVVAVSVTVGGQTATGPDFTVTDGGGGGNAPTIDSITPTEGEVGTAVTITGSNFGATASDNTVEFGGVQASINSASETEVVAVVPNSLGAGAVDVTLTANGQTATSPQQFTVTVPAPVIDAINPTEGEVGTAVTITGSNFGATASDNTVEFSGVQASINSASETEVVAVVPNSLGAGAVDVTLTANGQTATSPQQFTVTVPAPVIDTIDPTSGTVGTEVTITGENFSSTATENTVTFGGTEATVNSASETELVAVVPSSLSPGSYAVEVTVNSQTATGPDFTVLEEGSPQFPITGSNASIDYGGCSLCGITNPTNVIDGNTDNFATVNLPLSIASGYWVSVESAGNIPAGGNAGFVVANEGGLIGLDLLEGITITTYLDGTVQETISDAALLNLEVVSGTTDRQFVSFQTSSEFDEIRIEFGSLLGADSDYLIYAAYGGMEAEPVPGPAINSVAPERGPEGSEVTITGSNFSATASENTVTFNGTEVTNITSASETELVVEVPTGATTGPVAVTTAGGTATSTDDFVVGSIPLTGSGLTATGDIQGVCLGCAVTNPSNVIDSDGDNFASIEISVGVGGSGYVAVENTAEVMSGGGRAGFVISRAGGTIDLSLIESVTIETYLDGSLQESVSGSSLLLLDLLSGTSTDRQFLGFDTTEDFDQIVISLGALVGADATYEVYGVYDDYFVRE